MGKKVDKTGMKYGRLTVLHSLGTNDKGAQLWLCKCECGKTKVLDSSKLNTKCKTKSCGCLNREIVIERNRKRTQKRIEEMRGTRLHHIWCNIKYRCYNHNSSEYAEYGGRGVKMCDEWKNDYSTFRDWSLTHGYTDELTIDRIDVNGNYEPQNCRWATVKTQQNNRRCNRFYECNGEKLTETQWCERLGFKSNGEVKRRINRGWSIEKALTTPARKVR